MTAHKQNSLSTLMSEDPELSHCERYLAYAIKDVVADFCLIDASILITYIRNNLHANINDLVKSASELFFREDTLCYGHTADVDFNWGKSPAVTLDMEFVHPTITVFFQLVMRDNYIGVVIRKLLISDASNPDGDLQSLKLALGDAMLSPHLITFAV